MYLDEGQFVKLVNMYHNLKMLVSSRGTIEQKIHALNTELPEFRSLPWEVQRDLGLDAIEEKLNDLYTNVGD